MAKWVKGQSGNPRGRPRRGRTAAALMRTIAAEKVAFEDRAGARDEAPEVSLLTRRERLVRVLWTMALDGDLAACRMLLEYMEGKPAQRMESQATQEVRINTETLAQAESRLRDFYRSMTEEGQMLLPGVLTEDDHVAI